MAKVRSLRSVWQIGGMILAIYLLHISIYGCYWYFHAAGNEGKLSLEQVHGDHILYLTQVADVLKHGAHFFQQDPYVFEHMDSFLPQGNVLFILYAILLRLIGSVNGLLFAAPLISLSLAGWLACLSWRTAIGRPALDNKPLVLLALTALLCTTFRSHFYLPEMARHLLGIAPFSDVLPQHYCFRFPYIQGALFLLIGWYWRLGCMLRSPGWKNAALLGGTMVLLQYTYFYFWTGALVLTGLHLLVSFKWKRGCFVNCGVVGIVWLAFSLPYWITFMEFNQLPVGADYAARMGADIQYIYSRGKEPFVIMLAFLLFDLGYVYLGPGRKGVQPGIARVLSLSREQLLLSTATILCLNLQLFIGYTIQSYHWLYTFYHPLIILIGFAYALRALEWLQQVNVKGLRWNWTAACLVAANAVIWVSLISAVVVSVRRSEPSVLLSPEQMEVIDHVRQHAPKNSVVLSNDFRLMHTLNLYTSSRSFLPYACMSLVTDEEILQRAFTGYRTLGFTADEIVDGFKYGTKPFPGGGERNLESFGKDTLMRLFIYTYRRRGADRKPLYLYPDHVHARLNELKTSPLTLAYKLDYLVIDKVVGAKLIPRQDGQARPVFENKRYLVLARGPGMPAP